MFSELQIFLDDCAIIHRFTGGNSKCDVGLCQFTSIGANV